MARESGPLGFDQVFAAADSIPGWLTRTQARVLYDAARAVPPGGRVVEIGSHHGRSAAVLAAALPPGARLVAVDPFPDDWRYGEVGTEQRFRDNLERIGVADAVDLHVAASRDVRRSWRGGLALAYIDGKHDYWTLADDLKWAAHLPPGAPILVHDCYSSIGVTLCVLAHVLPSRRIRYERRTGSMALFRVGPPSYQDRLRIVREIPWWLRNVAIKVLLRLRLRPVASLVFGHDSPYDPY